MALALAALFIGRAVRLRLARGTQMPAAAPRRSEWPARAVLPLLACGAADLRCHVRESLVDFMQRTCPQYLPTRRAEVDGRRESVTEVTDSARVGA